jgi:hypothetical protein
MAETDPVIDLIRYILLGVRVLVLTGLVVIVLYRFRRSTAGKLITIAYIGSIATLVARTLVFTLGMIPHEKGGDVHGYMAVAVASVDAALLIILAAGIAKIPKALRRGTDAGTSGAR